jgi:hypothetical protein
VSDRDWFDAFDDDEAARERGRRRAEREARRRERRRTLADKVRSAGEGSAPVATPPSDPQLPSEPQPPPPRGPEASPPPQRPPAPLAGAAPAPSEPPPSGGNGGAMRRRRAVAIGVLAAGLAALLFGAMTLADRIGGGGEEEEAPAAEVEETITVTIPEGLDRRQTAAVVREAGVRGNYVKATRRAKGFNTSRFGADGADHLEGFLFPATYELRSNARVGALIKRQLDAFRQRIRQVDMDQAESVNLNVYDVLKIASMIEREVQIPRERRLVSAVIYNRLADGSPLGIDATIRYEDQNFDQPLTESRLNEPTPYNTRVNAGLPPTPIGNPGLAAIRAAANPADVDHFYYVVKPHTCGEHVFTASEEEFQQAVAEYQRALEEEGGAPTPDDC